MEKKAGVVIDDDYFELVRRFPLKPLTSDKELDQAIEVVNSLVDRGFDNLTRGEEAYLDVLSDLVEKYESEHHPISDASPVEMLRFFIDDRKTNQRAVALGSRIAVSTMSEILAGRRQMNLEHMQKLARFFNVDVAVFLPRATTPRVKPEKVPTARRAGARPRKKAFA